MSKRATKRDTKRNSAANVATIEASVFARENNIDAKRVRARIRRAVASNDTTLTAHIVANDKRWLFKRSSVAALKALFA